MSPGSSSSRWSTRHGRSRRRRASSASRTWPFSTVTLPSAPRTSPQITRPSRAATAAPSRASATGFIYSALASPCPPLRLGHVSARTSIQPSPHRALPFGSATFRLEHLFSPRLTVPSPSARPRFGSNIYSALASPCPPLRLGHVSARTSFDSLPDLFADGQAGRAALNSEHLGQDSQRDLGRRLGAEVEADGHAHPGQQILGDAILSQEVEDGLAAPARAEEADVADRRLERVLQHGQ